MSWVERKSASCIISLILTVALSTDCITFVVHFWWVKASTYSPRGKRLIGWKGPGFKKDEEEDAEKFNQSLWIWHKATSILHVSGLLDVMSLSNPSTLQPLLVNPSQCKVRRIGSGLSFCWLQDDPWVFKEQQSQGFCQCHLHGWWEWQCLCDISEPISASSTGVLKRQCFDHLGLDGKFCV